MKYRQQKLNSLIREELSKIIQKNLEFDSCLPTLTAVEISEDLVSAIVRVSVLPSSEEKSALKILNNNSHMLKHSLLKKLRIRAIPRLFFKIDKGLEKAARVEKILLNDNINND